MFLLPRADGSACTQSTDLLSERIGEFAGPRMRLWSVQVGGGGGAYAFLGLCFADGNCVKSRLRSLRGVQPMASAADAESGLPVHIQCCTSYDRRRIFKGGESNCFACPALALRELLPCVLAALHLLD
eukprot:6181273-Pleurochrysis_carterae.AAC.3